MQGSVSKIQNPTQSAVVQTNTDGTVSMKANGGSTSLVVSANGSQYTVANGGNLTLQTNGVLTLNPASYTQATTPILCNSSAPTQASQVLNRTQNDARYYQNTTPLNQITGPTGDVPMGGYTLSNIRDAVSNLEPTNLAQVTSLIANSGFKNKIQSQSGHASVTCNEGSDTISIKTNDDPTTIDVSSNGAGTYTVATGGTLVFSA